MLFSLDSLFVQQMYRSEVTASSAKRFSAKKTCNPHLNDFPEHGLIEAERFRNISEETT
jgi:hypothetical protein